MGIDWTHRQVTIKDIRKVRKFYILSIEDVDNPIFVDQNIFEGRVASYYLKDPLTKIEFERDQVLNVKWNMVISEGGFYKLDRETGDVVKINKDADKSYISFLEIDGPLGMHVPK